MSAIAVLGDINVDLALQVAAYPPEGGEGIADRQSQDIGGSATNTALVLARLGQPVRFIGRIGADAWGDWCLAEMQAAGIDTSSVGRDPVEPTQLNVVVVGGSGERTMFAYRGANAQLAAGDVEPSSVTEAALLHVSGYCLLRSPQKDAALRAIALAHGASVPVTLDIPSGVTGDIGGEVIGLLPQIDALFLGEADVRQLSGAERTMPLETAAGRLLDAGARSVVVKRGGEGSVTFRSGDRLSSPPARVDVVDTTGAGDAFAAGYILGLVAGLSAPATGALANAAGALAVSVLGPGTRSASREALLERVQSMPCPPALLAEVDPLLRN